jgi:hypothetical protein
MDAATYVINERPLTDDTVSFAPDGYRFKGGYAAVVTFHTFANPWADEEHVKRFRTIEAAEAFIVKRYGKTWEELLDDLAPED